MKPNTKCILIVDDDSDHCLMMKTMLEKTRRFEVHQESRSSCALETARRVRPDLILLDVVMPELDGGELATQIQDDPSLEHVPIVFLTGLITRSEEQWGTVLNGGFAFLSKPVLRESLVACIATSLRRRAVPHRELASSSELLAHC